MNEITIEEEKFIKFWEENRQRKKSVAKQFSLGLPLGMMMGIAILLCFETGWYTRANMVANSQSTPYVLIFAIIAITIFCSIFFQRHQWDMNEQRYRELLKKKSREKNG